MNEISKVVAEMRRAAEREESGQIAIYDPLVWADRIERVLQQPASADVEREAADMTKALEWVRYAKANYNFPLNHWPTIERAIIAALRKPQQEAEPVATVVAVRSNGTFVEQPALEWHKSPKKGDKLFTSPQPATCNGAIDLEQFREAVEMWMNLEDAEEGSRLLALIDAQEKGA